MTLKESFIFQGQSSQEIYFTIKPDRKTDFLNQLSQVVEKASKTLQEHMLNKEDIITIKICLSDYLNQEKTLLAHKLLTDISKNCAISIIEEPPADGTKINVLFYCIKRKNTSKIINNGHLIYQTPNYRHIFHNSKMASQSHLSIKKQTSDIFQNYINSIKEYKLNIKEHCIRTWLYIRDIDKMYGDVVEARKDFFYDNNLTEKTHYITSTGIEGKGNNLCKDVCIDFYTVGGIKQEQIKHLHALDYLNPTYEYGVTFERGTSVTYGDRKHVFISGTASIDNKGNTIFLGDVNKQLIRLMQNIKALLADAEAQMGDIANMTVYLRDYSDYDTVTKFFAVHFANIPKLIVIGKVCRPNWLIEVECIAISHCNSNQFPEF
ncbi:hypothetical protein E9993_12505 [Labilibacter sediminis]|nr:hypothetical protein E9993_12505 [Labilibacter sediminis]